MGQNFASSFAEGLPGGIQLAGEMREQGKARSAKKAGAILAQMQSYDPFASQDDPTTQGLPEQGQTTAANPNQGFDGHDFNNLSNEYFKAISGIGDIREYAAAQQLYGQMRMDKINQYIDAGLNSYDQGDMQGATRSLRGASAYMNPGTTPEITVDPNSGAFVVANYENGKPHSGYAITREQLMDMRGRNTDFNAWAQRDMADEHHKQEMGLRYAQFNASQKNANARLALQKSAADAKAEKDAVQLATDKVELATKTLEQEKMAATQESGIAADIATHRATVAEQGQKEANAAQVGAADYADAKNRERAAQDKDYIAYQASIFGDGKEDGLLMDAFQLPADSPTTGGAPGGSTTGAAIPADGSADTGNATTADQYSALGWPMAGNAAGKKTMFDPLLYDASPQGATLKQPIIDLAHRMSTDIWDMNGGDDGGVQAEVANSLIVGSINRSQTTQVVDEPADPQTGEGGRSYITDGISQFEVSHDTASLLKTYQETYKQEYARSQGREVPPSDIPPEANAATQEVPGAPAIPELPPTGGPVPATMAGPQRDASSFQQKVGIDTGGPAPAQLGGGYDTSAIQEPPAPVDDTAAAVSSGVRNIHGSLENAPTVRSFPELARAVIEWEAAGRDPNQSQRVSEILSKLPPLVAQRAAQEIISSGP